MINPFFIYAIESSVSLLLFMVVYRFLISDLTHFFWMRIYLLSSVVLSLSLPFLILPIRWDISIRPSFLWVNFNLLSGNHPGDNVVSDSVFQNIQHYKGIGLFQFMAGLLLIIYSIGLIFKTYSFIRSVIVLNKYISRNPKRREGNFWYVELNDQIPPFSFFNYIFLNKRLHFLSDSDLQQIKEHEISHSEQFHSLDILFVELTSIVFWFNPILTYLKKSLQEVHEYAVDERIAGFGEKKKNYAQLLLTLASDVKGFNLSVSFTGKQIKNRIIMITKPRSLPKYKLVFTLIIPLTVLLLLAFSYVDSPIEPAIQKQQTELPKGSQLKIGEINWNGNSVYDIKTLNNAFGLKRGSPYNQSLIEDRLNGSSGAQDAVSNLYQDKGYLYSRISFQANKNKEAMDLIITIEEGKQFKFNDIIVKIDGIISKDLLNEIGIYKGDLFSKEKIIEAIRALAASGKFDPEKINPTPFPNETTEKFNTVDLEFDLTKISNKK